MCPFPACKSLNFIDPVLVEFNLTCYNKTINCYNMLSSLFSVDMTVYCNNSDNFISCHAPCVQLWHEHNRSSLYDRSFLSQTVVLQSPTYSYWYFEHTHLIYSIFLSSHACVSHGSYGAQHLAKIIILG